MVSVFLREHKRYTGQELLELFKCSEEKVVRILKRLKEYGVLKTVKATDSQKDLTDLLEDTEISEVRAFEDEYLYVLTFVGVISIDGRILKCYPKYLLEATAPKDELKQILKVLEKYNSKEQMIRMHNEADGGTLNMLAVMLYLLQDYYEYGSYKNTQDIIEENGSGEIIWDKTINETFALMSGGRPYYTKLLTIKRAVDELDYFKRLHECVLAKCSKELSEAGLLDLFDIAGVQISDEEISDFGERDYILGRIQKELSIQFSTRKQLLLKTLYAYIASGKSLNDIDCFSMFGTNSFNLVWERVCAGVMDNQLNKPLGALKMPVALSGNYDKKALLISLIERPNFYGRGADGSVFVKTAAETLIPDIVSIVNHDGEYQLAIFDAKYYNISLEEGRPLKGQPGIESITKQYLYRLAYKRFAEDHGISKVKNYFLMPTDKEKIINKGYVAMDMFKALGLEHIEIRLLPAEMMYSLYIQNKRMDLIGGHMERL